jgi:glycosyltransferase involved in cell wall biosynthesis
MVIPAYNEGLGISKVVEDARKVLSGLRIPSEIIVVDDGSTDSTGAHARESGALVVVHEVNKGYGESIKSGIARASYDMVLIMDADGTYPCEAIPELVEQSRRNDMVVGARTAAVVHVPFLRRPVKWLLTRVANYLAGTRIPDLNSGLRIFRKDVAVRFWSVLPQGFSFTATLTLAMLCNGYRLTYVPINYHRRTGVSKIRPVYDTANFLQLVVRTALYFRPLKVFIPLGFALICLAVAILLYSYYALAKVMDVTVIVIFMTAVQVFTIGLLADLIDKRTQR